MKGFDVHRYNLNLSNHTYHRLRKNKISIKTIKSTIYGGKVHKFGKNYVKFVKKYRNKEISCVCEVKGEWLNIITITKR